VTKKKLIAAWIDGFKDNTSDAEYTQIKPQIDEFNALFETLGTGDIVLLDFLPDQSTRISIKGVHKGNIKGELFSQALLKIWLGKEPVTHSLKDVLLNL